MLAHRSLLALLLAAACRVDTPLDEPDADLGDPDDVPLGAEEDDGAEEVVDTDAAAPTADTGAPPAPVDTDVDAPADAPPCDVMTEWVALDFTFPPDALSCAGPQAVRFDATYGLYVGVVTCQGGFVRVYLSDDLETFLPALDLAGHGQDHCELLDPGFRIPNEDDITSGGCAGCATSVNLPLEGVAGWSRATFGQPFSYVDPTGRWSWQTSRIDCDVDPVICVP